MKSQLVFILIYFLSASAFACQCQQWESPEHVYQNSDVLFFGVPGVSVTTETRPPYFKEVATTFTIISGVKNVSGEKINVYSRGFAEISGTSCEIEWRDQTSIFWLVRASKSEDGRLYTDDCSVARTAYANGDQYENGFIEMVEAYRNGSSPTHDEGLVERN